MCVNTRSSSEKGTGPGTVWCSHAQSIHQLYMGNFPKKRTLPIIWQYPPNRALWYTISEVLTDILGQYYPHAWVNSWLLKFSWPGEVHLRFGIPLLSRFFFQNWFGTCYYVQLGPEKVSCAHNAFKGDEIDTNTAKKGNSKVSPASYVSHRVSIHV